MLLELIYRALDLEDSFAVPPVLVRRMEEVRAIPGSCDVFRVKDDGAGYTIIVPKSFRPGGKVDLRIHFHTEAWLPAKEHLAAGLNGPLVVWNRSGASSAYRVPFEDRGRIWRIIDEVEEILGAREGRMGGVKVGSVSVSSFSAGYGAVREIVKDPEFFRMLKRVVLCDSIYASLDASFGDRRAKREDVEPFFPLAEAAVRGEKTFLLTFSEVPTEYASSSESGAAIARHVGGRFDPVLNPSPERPLLEEYRCYRQFQKGNFNLWQYPGHDAPAHVVHVWNLGRLWRALDTVGAP